MYPTTMVPKKLEVVKLKEDENVNTFVQEFKDKCIRPAELGMNLTQVKVFLQ